jgi:hypothetical protein
VQTQRLKNEADSLLDRDPRNFQELVAICGVRSDERVVSPDSFIETLLALVVLLKNSLPWWGDEYATVVPEHRSRPLHVFWRRDTRQPQISQHVGHPSVEEHWSGGMLGNAVRPHCPTQHHFREKHGVRPGQRDAANYHLILNDAPAGFDRPGIAISLQPVDERTLPEPSPPVTTKKRFSVSLNRNLPFRGSVRNGQ